MLYSFPPLRITNPVGNILTGNGHTYTYGDTDWKDLLTAVDGEAITYDAIGNPTSYYNGTRWTLTWEDGKELATATDGTNSISYTYDADGLRTSKTVNGVKHTYYYAGGKLLRETFGTDTLDFFYDSNGYPYALKHNGTLYYYITNLQGDVMFIVDGNGAVVAAYSYDPYGNVITAAGDLASVNPLRYRGYYYDGESGLYYLQSRYYDPELGRFINADDYASTGQGILGNNMFAYCLNNPVNGCDPCGTCIHRWDFWNDCDACGGQTIGDKWVDYYENGLTATFTLGVYGSANLGAFNVTGSVEFAFDLKGNIQLVASGSFDVTSSGGFSASAGATSSVFIMPDTSYLAGDTNYMGGSLFVRNPAGVGSAGIAGNVGKTSDGYWGVNGSLGIGTSSAVGLDFHGGHTTTVALTEQFNIFEWVTSTFS